MRVKTMTFLPILLLIASSVLAQRGRGGPNDPDNKNVPAKIAKFKSDLLVSEIKYADLIVSGKIESNKPDPKNSVAKKQAKQIITLKVNDVLKGDKKAIKNAGVTLSLDVRPFMRPIVESKKGTPNVYILFSDGPGTDTYHIKFPDDVVPINQSEVIRALARN